MKRNKPPPPLGVAQLTLVEHSLCPLSTEVSLQPNLNHTTRFRYRDSDGRRRQGTAVTHMPRGFSLTDEFHLWGMLALTLRQPKPEAQYSATPHFILRELGSIDASARRGGKNYRLFRKSMERLAVASYVNDSFYDPIRKIHDHRVFGFLKFRAPQDLNSDRLWHFYWDPLFFEFCMATGGRFQFDLQTYRELDAASRRLFLLLHKIFYRRRTSPVFCVKELMTNVLGYSETLSNSERNRKLKQIANRLHHKGVVQFCATDIQSTERAWRVQFRRGDYFEALREARNQAVAGRSPLVDALTSMGFENDDARRICGRYDASLLREWIDITIAFEERNGPNAFKRSRQAYLVDNLKHAAAGSRGAPEWWQEIRRRESQTEERRNESRALRELRVRLAQSTSADHAVSSDPKSNSNQKPVHRIGDILGSVS